MNFSANALRLLVVPLLTVGLVYGLVRAVCYRQTFARIVWPLSIAPLLMLELLLFFLLLYGIVGCNHGIASQFLQVNPLVGGMATAVFLGLAATCLSLLAQRYSLKEDPSSPPEAGTRAIDFFIRYLRRNRWYLVVVYALAAGPIIPGLVPRSASLMEIHRLAWIGGLVLGATFYLFIAYECCRVVAWSRRERILPADSPIRSYWHRFGRGTRVTPASEATGSRELIDFEGDVFLASATLILAIGYLVIAVGWLLKQALRTEPSRLQGGWVGPSLVVACLAALATIAFPAASGRRRWLSAIAVVVMAGLLLLVETPPVVVGCLLFSLFAALYTLIVYRHPVHQLPVILVVLLVLSFTNGTSFDTPHDEFKYQFPNLDRYYDEEPSETDLYGLDIDKYQAAMEEDAIRAKQTPATVSAAGDAGAGSRLLASPGVLGAWRGRMDRLYPEAAATGRKPRLVIVTTTGGGIRAAVWTAEVLTELEREFARHRIPFHHHIRLITGASGGMVGASFYVVSLDRPAETAAAADNLRDEPLRQAVVRAASADSLGAVLRTMLIHDLPSILIPLSTRIDRGIALEETWHQQDPRMAAPIRSLRSDELEGWRPSLVFSPMLVEDGRRILISNLDLGFISRNHAPMLKPQYPAISRQAIEAKAAGGKSSGQPPPPAGPGLESETGLASFSAVEFFRLFPEADRFQLSTAARMSATFPYVSPTVYLPTRPPRRVVDAGYYDNYGVNVAAMWMLEFRDWLMKNTSGVALIEIRDHDGQRQRVELDYEPKTARRTFTHRIWLGSSSLISPVSGLFAARSASMMYRNDEQLEWLGSYLPRGIDDRNGGVPLFRERADYDSSLKKAGDFFVSLALEAPRGVSLSWTLTDLERTMLHAAIADRSPEAAEIPDVSLLDEVTKVRGSNRERIAQLVKWWLEID